MTTTTNLTKWTVRVEVDERGGDDDVFEVLAVVYAANEADALAAAEKRCADKYGARNVLGAYGAVAA